MGLTSDKPINQEFKVKEADAVEVLSLVDSSVDFLSTIDRKEAQSLWQWTRERYSAEWARTHTQVPVAEHGFSMLVRVFNEEKSRGVKPSLRTRNEWE
jgi:hypothetical protein